MIYDTMMCVLRDIYTAKQQLKLEHRDRKRTNTLKKLKHKNDFHKKRYIYGPEITSVDNDG